MQSADFVRFALQIAVMLACGLAGGWLMRRIQQPAVLGEMLAGILLGPTILGLMAPAAYTLIFPANDAVALVRGGTIKLGMLFFLFSVGAEIDLGSLRKNGYRVFLIGALGTGIPLFAGIALVYLVPGLFGPLPEHQKFPFALFIGAALANSANPVLARILHDLGQLKQDLGVTLMTATLFDDIICWCLLALVVGQFQPASMAAESEFNFSNVGLVLLFFVGVMAFGRFVGLPFLRAVRPHLSWPSGMIAVVTVLILISAAASERLGIHAFLGPFLLGISLAHGAEEKKEAFDVINQFAMSFFVPIYFVSMGLTTNFVRDFEPLVVTAIFVTACVSKIASGYLAGRLTGSGSAVALAIGCGLNARGAVGVILAGLGLENHVINHTTYVALIVMALGTSLMAGPLMSLFLRRAGMKAELSVN